MSMPGLIPPSAHASHASGFAPNMNGHMNGPPPMQPNASQFSGMPNQTSTSFAPPPSHAGMPMSNLHPGHPDQSALSLHQSRIDPRNEPPPLSTTIGPMPGTIHNPIMGPKKRLILLCDGTWLDADNSIMHGKKQPPSNVSRMSWAVKETSRDGIPQVVSYMAGVGTAGTRLSRIIGGATGMGLKENIREAYTYIATNWREGDEIFLMGFSRGAFTARSVGGLIGDLGLLTRKGLPYFNEIFDDYEHKQDDRYTSAFPDAPFRDKGRFDDRYVHELERQGMTRRRIPIKAICCWDTVGSLGIPRTPFSDRRTREFQFDDTKIHPCVENAFQALALDESRAPFSPALWEKGQDNNTTNLKQVWFCGVHSNVGGGYEDQELANITLSWMMSRLEPFLDFRPDFLVSQLDAQRQYYKDTGQKPRWWSFGEIYKSLKGVYTLTGSKVRTPGSYTRAAPNGRTTSKRLKNTNEYVHASVRARVGLRGPGPLDRGDYNPPALADWTFEPEPSPPGAASSGQGGNLSDGMMVVWNYRGSQEKAQTRIPEAPLLETELALLRQFQPVDDYIRFMRPPGKEKRKSKRHTNGQNTNTNGNGNAVPYASAGQSPYGRPSTGHTGRPSTAGRDRTAYAENEGRRSMPAPDDFAVPVDGEMDHDGRKERRRRRRSTGPPAEDDSDSDLERAKAERRRRRTSARY